MIDVEKQTSSAVEEDRPDGVGMMLVGRVGGAYPSPTLCGSQSLGDGENGLHVVW
jgi:hypothetical protein